MDIIARFFLIFGGSFLGIAVVIFSFLRRRIFNKTKRFRKKKKKGLFR